MYGAKTAAVFSFRRTSATISVKIGPSSTVGMIMAIQGLNSGP